MRRGIGHLTLANHVRIFAVTFSKLYRFRRMRRSWGLTICRPTPSADSSVIRLSRTCKMSHSLNDYRHKVYQNQMLSTSDKRFQTEPMFSLHGTSLISLCESDGGLTHGHGRTVTSSTAMSIRIASSPGRAHLAFQMGAGIKSSVVLPRQFHVSCAKDDLCKPRRSVDNSSRLFGGVGVLSEFFCSREPHRTFQQPFDCGSITAPVYPLRSTSHRSFGQFHTMP